MQPGKQAKEKAAEVLRRLRERYPDAECALHHKNPWQLLCATILSAQCTDVRVNMVTPHLFAKYPTKQADPEKIEQDLMALFPKKDWTVLGHTLIHHGRTICIANRPKCPECPVNDLCPYGRKVLGVTLKPLINTN